MGACEVTVEFGVNVLEGVAGALVVLDVRGQVKFWNSGAESLFGYGREEVLGKRLPFISDDSFFEIETMVERAKFAKQFIFKTQKAAKDGTPLELIVSSSPLYEGNELVAVVAVFNEINLMKRAIFIPYTLMPFLRDAKRTFPELRDLILLTLGPKKMTINQIAHESGVNWRTVEKHLTYMIGKKMVEELFSSEYVRIFELTEEGRRQVNEVKRRELAKVVKIER